LFFDALLQTKYDRHIILYKFFDVKKKKGYIPFLFSSLNPM